MEINTAVEHFKKVLESQERRAAEMRAQGDFVDYASLPKIVIGICGGDGRTRTAPDINYGTGGLLTGRYMISSTWNAPRAAFVAEGDFFEGTGIDGVFLPMHKAFQFIGLKPMESFMANDVLKNPTHEADFKRFVETVKKNFSTI